MFRVLKTIRVRLRMNKVSENMHAPPVLRTLSGDRMIFNVLEERELYFQTLSNSWNAAPR